MVIGDGARLSVGAGVYLSSDCGIETGNAIHLVIQGDMYMNDNCLPSYRKWFSVCRQGRPVWSGRVRL